MAHIAALRLNPQVSPRITSTPWGAPQDIEQIAPGICFVSTASHGGYYLDAIRNACVPLAWRRASFNGHAITGWYEEDCDACMVPLAFPEAFPAAALPRAQQCFDHWIAPKLSSARSAKHIPANPAAHQAGG